MHLPFGQHGLYSGLFQPERYETYLPPFENFTVEVTISSPTGTSLTLLGVAYFLLVGVSRRRIA